IPSPDCNATACKQHNAFDPSKSKNFKLTKTPFKIQYGSGNVSGLIAKDDLSIAGIKSTGQIFGLTLNESKEFENVPYDGLMGMALDQLSTQNATTPFSNMVKQKSVKNPFFWLPSSTFAGS
ncbi:19160_t:CDS:1, partial [Cetraspora pellucida]